MHLLRDIKNDLLSLKQDNTALKHFLYTWCIIVLFIGGVLYYLGNPFYKTVIGADSALFLLGIVSKTIRRVLYITWMGIGFFLGWIVTRVVLSVVYFTLITLMGMVMRLLKKDILDVTVSKERVTYWQPYRITSNKERYRKQF